MRRWGQLAAGGLVVALAAGGGTGAWVYLQLRRSLPLLEGRVMLKSLQGPVQVKRDDQGAVTIEAQTRLDAARALGFVHAQERFFQMDLLRRRAAGELAELVGEAALGTDRTNRIHRFRRRAKRVLAEAGDKQRQLLQALPCGQSGHPLSPHYRDGYADWAQGRPTPFSPGPTVTLLELVGEANRP